MKKTKLIDTEGISKILKRLSFEIIEANPSLENIAIVGIRTRGDVIAKRIAEIIKDISKSSLVPSSYNIYQHLHLLF